MGVILSHNVPTTFLANELFVFRGNLVADNLKGVYVFVILIKKSDSSIIDVTAFVPAGQKTFEVPVEMIGDVFYLGFSTSSSPNSFSYSYYTTLYTITSSRKTASLPIKFASGASKVAITFKNNDLIASWINP